MDDKLKQIQKLLDVAEGNLHSARNMIRDLTGGKSEPLNIDDKLQDLSISNEGKIIEGVFNGEQMVGPDNKTYSVPPNYASKSKLVEGDTLKLTIAEDGSYIYKQIQPTERRNAVGTLAYSEGGYTVSSEGRSYKVLTASVTFYKAEAGDQVTIILPSGHESTWAAIENVVPKVVAESATPAENNSLSTPPVAPIPVAPSSEETKIEPETQAEVSDNSTAVNVSKNTGGPDIEFPANTQPSDDELLRKLKDNLQKIQAPPVTANAKPVDNIVAGDLAKSVAPAQEPPKTEQPIKELDI